MRYCEVCTKQITSYESMMFNPMEKSFTHLYCDHEKIDKETGVKSIYIRGKGVKRNDTND